MKAWLTVLAVVVVIALGVGSVGFYLWAETEGWDRGYSVGYDDAYDLAWDEGYSEGYDAGWAVRQAEPLQLFKSVAELREWLSQDDTDSIPYVDDVFDCDDFAITLARNAAADGYFISVYLTEDDTHMMNFAFLEGKPEVIYLIEPQTDWVRIPPMRLD